MSADGVGHGAEDFARKLLVDDRHARRILVVVPLERAKVRSFLRLWFGEVAAHVSAATLRPRCRVL